MQRRIIMVGLDGAPPHLIESWIEKGLLPTFEKLIKEGCYGTLRSPIPHSAIAFTSLTTGKAPWKHGILDWVRNDGKLVSSNDVKDRRLWDILGDYGKKSGVVNIPVTYPPKPLNGFMITDQLTPPGKKFTYPESLEEELPEYEIEIEFKDYRPKKDSFSINDITHLGISLEELRKYQKKLVEKIFDVDIKRIRAFFKLFQEKEWDLFLINFRGSDSLQHLFWDKNEILLEYYQLMDEMLRGILDRMTDNDLLFVFSDHGFGPQEGKIFHINAWLKKEGYLSTNFLHEKVYGILKIFYKFYRKFSFFRRNKNKTGELAHTVGRKISSNLVDMQKSSAYGEVKMEIGIRVTNKEVTGEIIQKLKNLEDPGTGIKIIDNICERHEVSYGQSNEVPNILFSPNPEYHISTALSEKVIQNTPKVSGVTRGWNLKGCHHNEGMLIVWGKDVKKNERISRAAILDLTPTVCFIYNIPIPSDIDGRVLKEIFEEESELSKREVRKTREDEKEILKRKIRELKKDKKI